MVNRFYTVEPVYVQVEKEEFEHFINDYPRKLRGDVYGVCVPPLITYNDFELANRWPYSIVAMYDDEEDMPNSTGKNTYKIMQNFQEVFNSKTGYKAGIGE